MTRRTTATGQPRCPWCGSGRTIGTVATDRNTTHRCTACKGVFHAYPGGHVVYAAGLPAPAGPPEDIA